ncbi:MAG: carboxypeptidase regulatory-like domain-containing protein [Acidobacteria bacterium]|nr:carboxypeptidase regulatory-like domain-containing protein [Acidobacteriota bacterium]
MLPLGRKLILSLLLAGLSLQAQTLGKIQGTITDPTGSVVPGAKVSIVHTATAREYSTTSNPAGFYLFPAVQNGQWSITISSAGMEAFRGAFLLETGQTAVVDAGLKVGATSTEVTVSGDVVPLVTTTSATLAQVTDRARIEQLPISGRMFQTLVAQTTPGIDGESFVPRVWGIRWGVEFLQDGAVLANRDTGEISGRPPGMDTIEEFRVETNNSSAKLNRPGTVIVNTRSGTNKFHGSLYEVARNNNLGFGVARTRQDFSSRPGHLVRNEFGGSAGGPVVLPKLYNGRNKTFWFGSYEAFRSLSASTKRAALPRMEWRDGDFSSLVDGAGRRYTLYDPWSTGAASANYVRVPYINNQIPSNRMSPLAKYLYSVTPVPNLPGVNPLVANNYVYLAPNNRLEWTLTSKVDHRISDRDQLSVRFTKGVRDSFAQSGNNNSPTTLDNAANGTWRPIRNYTGVVNWTHTFSPTFFSETSFNVSSEDLNFINVGDNKKYADQLGLPNPFDEYGFPNMTGTGVGMEYITAANRRNAINQIYNIDQNMTKIWGKHELQFGGRLRYEALNILPDQQFVSGSYAFGSQGTGLFDPSSGTAFSAVPFSGHNAADVYLGILSSYRVQFVRKWYTGWDGAGAGYLQDNIRVNNRLTLNLGVRYELIVPLRESTDILTGFDPASKTVINGADWDVMYKNAATTPAIRDIYTSIGMKFGLPSEFGLPTKLMYLNKLDFNPRAGFAYRLTTGPRPLVVRGGYGLYAYDMPLRAFDARARSNPPTTAAFTYSYSNSAQTPDRQVSYGLRSTPQYIAGVNTRNVIDTSRPGAVSRGDSRISYFNPHQPTSRAHEWNLTFEREVLNNTVARVGYVGTHGSRMDMYYSYNQAPNAFIWYATTGLPLPTGIYQGTARRAFEQTVYGDIEEYRKTGWSNAQSFQFELQRRYSKGYGFQVYYVLSNNFRAGGNGWSDSIIPSTNVYLPGAVPTDVNELARFLFYQRDTGIPKHRVNYNWIVDIPVGRGKRIAGQAGPIVNRIIGGWQLAGQGTFRNSWWALPTGNWLQPNPVEVYGTKYPIKDCRSGTCFDGYLYYNGYIPANRINSTDPRTGLPNGVMGVPSDYKPSHAPLIPIPANGGSSADPNFPFYDTNTVWIRMKDGSLQRTAFNDNLNPWNNQFLQGLFNWELSSSLFKVIPVTERVFFRLNVDFFNTLNMPGIPKTPNSATGIIDASLSGNGARAMQFGLRLTW